MDRIFYSNEEFAKASEMSLKRVDLNSQDEYDALTSEQKNDETKLYFVKPEPILKWDFTKSMVDEKKGVEATIVSGTGYRDSGGFHFSDEEASLWLVQIDMRGKILEIDVAEMSIGDNSKDVPFISNSASYIPSAAYFNTMGTLKNETVNGQGGWYAYLNNNGDGSSMKVYRIWSELQNNKTIFDGKTVRVSYGKSSGIIKLWVDGQFIQQINGAYFRIDAPSYSNVMLMIGEPLNGGNLTGTIITGVRIYNGGGSGD